LAHPNAPLKESIMVTAKDKPAADEPAPQVEVVEVNDDAPAPAATTPDVEGSGTEDDPYKIPASQLAGSDGRPSVTIPRPDPGVQIVYDDVPDPESSK
jgi:hypothetical protein